MAALLSLELITKGGLAAADPVHLICLVQIIMTVVVVAGLLILGGMCDD